LVDLTKVSGLIFFEIKVGSGGIFDFRQIFFNRTAPELRGYRERRRLVGWRYTERKIALENLISAAFFKRVFQRHDRQGRLYHDRSGRGAATFDAILKNLIFAANLRSR